MNKRNNLLIIQGIKDEDNKLISDLLTEATMRSKGTLISMGLDKRDMEEAVLDSMVIFINKIKRGQIVDEGVDIMHYLVKTIKFRAYFYLRKKNMDLLEISQIPESTILQESNAFENWDNVLESMQKLPPQRRHLLELTFLEGFSDKEILEKNLSAYSTIASLKTQRYKAIRQLAEIVHGNNLQ